MWQQQKMKPQLFFCQKLTLCRYKAAAVLYDVTAEELAAVTQSMHRFRNLNPPCVKGNEATKKKKEVRRKKETMVIIKESGLS